MAFSCGFFNSKNQDRKYDATEFGAIFDGLISDGVYMSIGDHFNVTATSGMKINVGSGRAWFNHTWTLNTGSYEMTIDQAEVIQDRIDAVVLDVDHRLNYRKNTFVIVKGTRSTSPVKPTLIQEEYTLLLIFVFQLVLHQLLRLILLTLLVLLNVRLLQALLRLFQLIVLYQNGKLNGIRSLRLKRLSSMIGFLR